jgi:hypothetical protein
MSEPCWVQVGKERVDMAKVSVYWCGQSMFDTDQWCVFLMIDGMKERWQAEFDSEDEARAAVKRIDERLGRFKKPEDAVVINEDVFGETEIETTTPCAICGAPRERMEPCPNADNPEFHP